MPHLQQDDETPDIKDLLQSIADTGMPDHKIAKTVGGTSQTAIWKFRTGSAKKIEFKLGLRIKRLADSIAKEHAQL